MANILVVDDESGIRELLSEILTDNGHQVETAGNAAEARQAVSAASYDLILLDIWMPDTDGVSLLKEWNSRHAIGCPVIMMSGHATIDTAIEATKFGAFDFIEKPMSLSRLLESVRQVLNKTHPVIPSQQPPASVAAAAAAPALVPAASPARTQPPAALTAINFDAPLREARDQFERLYFQRLLEAEHYSMTRVSERSGLERTHLYRKLKQLNLSQSRTGKRTES